MAQQSSINWLRKKLEETYGGQGSPDTTTSPNTKNK